MICPICQAAIPDHSRYCNMCGIAMTEAAAIVEEEKRSGKRPLVCREIRSEYGPKTIEVYCSDITQFPEKMDLLTISAFAEHYAPVPRTVIHALEEKKDIHVETLAQNPYMDLRRAAGCWISDAIPFTHSNPNVSRIGCVELLNLKSQNAADLFEAQYLSSIQAYFRLIDVLSFTGAEVNTVVSPLLGSGKQHFGMDIIKIPLVNEALSLLRRNPSVKRFIFLERTYEKAQTIADTIVSSYQLSSPSGESSRATSAAQKTRVFISYCARSDVEAAQLLSATLEKRGIQYWFAPSNIMQGDYAEAIVNGIKDCSHFVCLISRTSMTSEHMLNEIDLAFHRLPEGIKIIPFFLEECELRPSFQYYLARMKHSHGTPPPLEARMNDLANLVINT